MFHNKNLKKIKRVYKNLFSKILPLIDKYLVENKDKIFTLEKILKELKIEIPVKIGYNSDNNVFTYYSPRLAIGQYYSLHAQSLDNNIMRITDFVKRKPHKHVYGSATSTNTPGYKFAPRCAEYYRKQGKKLGCDNSCDICPLPSTGFRRGTAVLSGGQIIIDPYTQAPG